MLLAIGIYAPFRTSGQPRRGWLIHELYTKPDGTQGTIYRGFFDAQGQTNAVILRTIGAYEVCNLIPVTASYFREEDKRPYRIEYGRNDAGVEQEAYGPTA